MPNPAERKPRRVAINVAGKAGAIEGGEGAAEDRERAAA
jgi:hypothetical protein